MATKKSTPKGSNCNDCVKGYVTTEAGQELECATCNGTGVNEQIVVDEVESDEEEE